MIVGGLRTRLIRESLFQTVHSSLGALGWFDSGRKHHAVNFRSHPMPRNVEIPQNTIVLVDAGINGSAGELGTNFTNFDLTFYFDIYAESDAVGMHLAVDIRDILEGRFNSIGRNMPNINVYDYSLATPVQFATVAVSDVMIDSAQDSASRPYELYWYSIMCVLQDSYTDEYSS